VFLGKNNKRETGKQFPLFPYLQQGLFPCFPVSLAKSKMLFPCFLVSRETGKQGNKQGNRETGKQKFGTLPRTQTGRENPNQNNANSNISMCPKILLILKKFYFNF